MTIMEARQATGHSSMGNFREQPNIRRRVTIKDAELITPARCHEWMQNAKNKGRVNRKLRKSNITRYALDMQANRWACSGESLSIDRDDAPLNGWHRILACIEADVGFWSIVIYDVDENVFPVFDTGGARSLGDHLSIAGTKQEIAGTLAAAVPWVEALEKKLHRGSIKLDSRETISRLRTDDSLERSVTFIRERPRQMMPATASALHYCFKKIDAAAAMRFFNDLSEGADLHIEDGAYVLREALISNKSARRKKSTRELMANAIRAWNARIQGLPVKGGLKGMIELRDGTLWFPDILDADGNVFDLAAGPKK